MIGLGVGTAVSGPQQHGITVDIIELHKGVRAQATSDWHCLAMLTSHPGAASWKGWRVAYATYHMHALVWTSPCQRPLSLPRLLRDHFNRFLCAQIVDLATRFFSLQLRRARRRGGCCGRVAAAAA